MYTDAIEYERGDSCMFDAQNLGQRRGTSTESGVSGNLSLTTELINVRR